VKVTNTLAYYIVVKIAPVKKFNSARPCYFTFLKELFVFFYFEKQLDPARGCNTNNCVSL